MNILQAGGCEVSFAHSFVRHVCDLKKVSQYFSLFCCFSSQRQRNRDGTRAASSSCVFVVCYHLSPAIVLSIDTSAVCLTAHTHQSCQKTSAWKDEESLAGKAYSLALFISGGDVFPERSPSDVSVCFHPKVRIWIFHLMGFYYSHKNKLILIKNAVLYINSCSKG